ncbi:MAG: hypothetical protein HYV32_02720 [Candidatus Kerfeldbacteria bacterium]|nr:hypothetical protein [Candidatus Kerfeldbacteria bacterium]
MFQIQCTVETGDLNVWQAYQGTPAEIAEQVRKESDGREKLLAVITKEQILAGLPQEKRSVMWNGLLVLEDTLRLEGEARMSLEALMTAAARKAKAGEYKGEGGNLAYFLLWKEQAYTRSCAAEDIGRGMSFLRSFLAVGQTGAALNAAVKAVARAIIELDRK